LIYFAQGPLKFLSFTGVGFHYTTTVTSVNVGNWQLQRKLVEADGLLEDN